MNITGNRPRALIPLTIILFFSLLAGTSSCVIHKQRKVLKLAHSLPRDHPVHKSMEYMATRLQELSGGKLTIQIYPSGQLGSEQQCVELVQIGSLAMTKVSAAVMESFTDDYKVLGLPYLFRSKQHAFNVLDGDIGKDILLSTEKRWIRGLCFYDAGSRSFYTVSKPIHKPEDLKGLKIRVMKSKTALEMVKAMGGSPTPLSWGELYTALQSGVVDGAENNPPSFYTSHHYEVCKYYTLDEHTTVPDVLIINKKVWDKLTKKEQQWLQQAANESVQVERKLWAESVKHSLETVKKAGVEIILPDKSLFRARVSPVYKEYEEQKVINDYITRIQNTHE
ncbi:MAG: TRAP transporter substrate-binding protein [Bacteroidales bacterium]|nr:TRAP transporter substrate-binding protein [Bacteroidales bacterium]